MIHTTTQIVETVGGSRLCFPHSFQKFHCLLELPDQLSLNIDLKKGNVHVYKKDINNIYQFLGELIIATQNHQLYCSVIPRSNSDNELMSITSLVDLRNPRASAV